MGCDGGRGGLSGGGFGGIFRMGRGEVVGLSGAAERAYGKERDGTTIERWQYKGESLGERRRRFEAYHCNHK